MAVVAAVVDTAPAPVLVEPHYENNLDIITRQSRRTIFEVKQRYTVPCDEGSEFFRYRIRSERKRTFFEGV